MNVVNRLKYAHKVRKMLFNERYPFPSCFKKIAWFILFIWSALCVIISVLCGLQFDLKYEEGQREQISNCGDRNIQYALNEEAGNIAMMQKQQRLESEFNDYDVPESKAWIISLVQSFLISVFIFQ